MAWNPAASRAAVRAADVGWWTAITVVVAVVAGVLVAVRPEQVTVVLLAVGPVGVLVVLRRKLAPSMLSPVYLTTVGFVLFALVGRALFQWAKAEGSVGAAVRISLSDAAMQDTTQLILVAAAAVATGAALFIGFAVVAQTRAMPAVKFQPLALPTRVQRRLLLGTAALLPVIVWSYGWHGLFRRLIYLPFIAHQQMYALVGELGMAAVVCLGYLFAVGRGGRRTSALTLATGYSLVYFAMGSRRFAMLPLLFALGGLSSAPRSRRWKLALVLALAASVTLVHVALYNRSLGSHGLWPYLKALPHLTDIPVGWKAITVNLLIGIGVIGQTAFQEPHIPLEQFFVSVNPLPGSLSGWYEIAAQHRLNRFTPYAALGELGNVGWAALISYYLTAGMVLAHLDWRIRLLLARGQQLYGLALVGLTVLFVVLSTEYNLRSATRLLYYAVALDVVMRIWLARAHDHGAP